MKLIFIILIFSLTIIQLIPATFCRADEIEKIELLELREKAARLKNLGEVTDLMLTSAYLPIMLSNDAERGMPITSPEFTKVCLSVGLLEASLINVKVGNLDVSKSLESLRTSILELNELVEKYRLRCSSK